VAGKLSARDEKVSLKSLNAEIEALTSEKNAAYNEYRQAKDELRELATIQAKLWFNTGNFKEVYKEMRANPYIQITTSSPTYQWIRLSGKAVFVDDKAIKETALENPIVKGNYQTADNPAFEVFYLEDAHGLSLTFPATLPTSFKWPLA
jgi:uncharacterized pyridoxamine 5'-phosphate oxidase family protein